MQAGTATPPVAPAPKRKRAAPPRPYSSGELLEAFTIALPKLGAVAAGRARAWRWPESGATVEPGCLVEHEGKLYVAWACTAIAPPSRCSWVPIDADDLEQARKWHVDKTERAARREEARRAQALEQRIAVAAALGRIDRARETGVDADDLSVRLRELERTALRDAGVYTAGRVYRAGETVTHNNALWTAQRATDAMPRGPDSGWRLVLKAAKR